MKKRKIRYYSSFSDDFVESRDQEYKVRKDYRYIRESVGFRILSDVIFSIVFLFGVIYCKLFLHVSFKDRRKLRNVRKKGGFIYCNHTQPIGDAFIPALACFPHRAFTVVSPSNFGIPIIGKLLPFLGALPVPDTLHGMRSFNSAIEYRANQNRPIVIYPEAHVWEYYTDIRPFSETSFGFPIKTDKPVYCMTVTYKKRCVGKRPKATVYIDGPFFSDEKMKGKDRMRSLRDTVYETMKKRSLNSTYSYIIYEELKITQ